MVRTMPLTEVATVIMGQSPRGETYNQMGNGLPLLNGPTEFGVTSPNCTQFTTNSQRECEFGDLIFCVRGSTTGRMNWADRKYSLGRGVCGIRGGTNAETRFIRYCIENRLHALLQLAGGGTFPNLTKDNIEEFKIPWPDNRVRIVGILSAYDKLIENNLKRIKILEEMARSLYREWFVNFRFPGHEKVKFVDSSIGKIPQGWMVEPLSALVDFAKGRKPTETREERLLGDVKLLLIDSLHGGVPVFTSPAKLVLAEARDTIMVMDGASSCEVFIGSCGAVGSTLGRFRTIRPDLFSPHTLYLFLEAKANEFKSKNIGAAIPHANKDYILTQMVVVPTKAVAARFDAQLESIQSQIETLKFQLQNLRRTRDLLLPRLMSGQIDFDGN